MDRTLVVVFDTEAKAYEGKKALLQLDSERSISVSAYAVVAKNADHTATVKLSDGPGLLGSLVGTSLGSLIGLLGGPTGFAIGAGAGLLAGAAPDLNNARLSAEFIDGVSKELQPNKFAVVAEIQEGWTTPVDTRMEAIGGSVYRCSTSEAKDSLAAEDVYAMQTDLARMKAELAQAHAERKAKLQEAINRLDSKLQAQLLQANDRLNAAEWEAKAKTEDLERKAEALDTKTPETHV